MNLEEKDNEHDTWYEDEDLLNKSNEEEGEADTCMNVKGEDDD